MEAGQTLGLKAAGLGRPTLSLDGASGASAARMTGLVDRDPAQLLPPCRG